MKFSAARNRKGWSWKSRTEFGCVSPVIHPAFKLCDAWSWSHVMNVHMLTFFNRDRYELWFLTWVTDVAQLGTTEILIHRESHTRLNKKTLSITVWTYKADRKIDPILCVSCTRSRRSHTRREFTFRLLSNPFRSAMKSTSLGCGCKTISSQSNKTP